MGSSESGGVEDALRLFFAAPLFMIIVLGGFLLSIYYMPPQIMLPVGIVSGLLLVRISTRDGVGSLMALTIANVSIAVMGPIMIFAVAVLFSGGLRVLRMPLRLIRGSRRRSRRSTFVSAQMAQQMSYLILFEPETGIFPVPFYLIVDPLFEPVILLSFEVTTYYLITSMPIIVLGILLGGD